MTEALLRIEELTLRYPRSGGMLPWQKQWNTAVDQVSLDIMPGETLGLVGESGCGKSSLGRAILQLHRPQNGAVWYRGQNLCEQSDRRLRPLRRQLQIVFQDPYESLNPRHSISDILEEPLIIHRYGDSEKRRKRIEELLDIVSLPSSARFKYPHEFSGGQRQRIGIARAIALNPEFIVCDEAVSALDVSVQAQILNLLMDIQSELNLTLLFISHDLAVVEHVSDRIAVMNNGRIVELNHTEELMRSPKDAYTQKLLAAIPRLS